MSLHTFDGHWKVDGRIHAVSGQIDDARVSGTVDGKAVAFAHRAATSDVFLGGVRTRVFVLQRGGRLLLSLGGRSFEFERVESHVTGIAADAFDPFAVSPMSGLVTKVHVAKGDRVTKGAPLFAVEAMKMEYVVKADRDVVIAGVNVTAGARIAINEPGVTFEGGPTT